jgi:hypothetical protein
MKMQTIGTDMSYWAVPESFIGTVIGGLSGNIALYHVVSAVNRPAGTPNNPVYGPYSTKAEAQTEADTLNGEAETGFNAGKAADPDAPPTVPAGTGGWFEGLVSGLTGRALWIRVVEVIIGGGLVIIGTAALLRKPIGEAVKVAPK